MEFLLIATAHFLALLSPGPDFFLIMQVSLRLPMRYGFSVCGGIAVANGIYLLGAVLGLEAIRQSSWLIPLMKYLGAGYLLFLGGALLRAPLQSLDDRTSSSFLHVESLGRQFMIGFMSAILNPKNTLFYLALFTVMVSEQTTLQTRFFYAAWMMSVVFIWDCCVVLLVARDKVRKLLGRTVYLVEKLSGAALALFGVLLPFS